MPKTDLVKAPNTDGTIGIYASASRPKTTVRKGDGTVDSHGPMVQVSRLGNPLVNEVIIPVGKKDYWNASDPKDDKQFLAHYRSPELTGLVNLLYPPLPDAPANDRDDLVAVLLTGVPGLNNTGNKQADLLRLNTAIAPTAVPNKLGAARRRLPGLPERPPARRRRDGHRDPCRRVRLRARSWPGRSGRLQPLAEQHRRRRGGCQRAGVPAALPLRGGAQPGLRPHGAQLRPAKGRRERLHETPRALRRRCGRCGRCTGSSIARRCPHGVSLRRSGGAEPVAESGVSAGGARTAVAELEAALAGSPRDPGLLASLGLAYQVRWRETGDVSYLPRSEAALRKALAVQRKDPAATLGLGNLALIRHEFGRALVLGVQASKLAPFSAQPHGVIGDAQIELGRYPAAFASFERMVR